MLSCLLNGERINCYDGQYSKEQLKKWADKKILVCPACGKPYEYCHGKIKSPYFRHMDKTECEDRYLEPETEEHMNGKRDLYEWIKKQQGVTDCILEGWIATTKQRPDIMFKYNGKQYVLEYQCTPIATEYYERHELYQAAGIKDIWILGTDKYLQFNMRNKNIQKNAYGFYSFVDKTLIPIEYNYIYDKAKKLIKYTYYHQNNKFIGRLLKNFVFDDEIYDSCIGKNKIIKDKQQYRDIFNNDTSNYIFDQKTGMNYKKTKDVYLCIQNDRINKDINKNLNILSNNNWTFSFAYTHSKYRDYEYIVANPLPKSDYIKYYGRKVFVKNPHYYLEENLFELDGIKVWKLTYDELKKCARDINFLKQLLFPIMKTNRKRALECKNDFIRFIELLD